VNTEIAYDRPVDEERTLGIGDMLAAMWQWRWLLVVPAMIGLTDGMSRLARFERSFEASMVVQPGQGTGLPGIGGAVGANPLGGALGQIFGATTRTATPFDRMRVTLGSRILARRLIERHDMLRRIYVSSVDKETGGWKRPTGEAFDLGERFRARLKLATWRPFDDEDLALHLTSGIAIKEIKDAGGGFYRVSYRHRDAQFALWVLETVFEEAQSLTQEQDLSEAKDRMRYLESRLAATTLLDQKQVLLALLANEERRMMILSAGLRNVTGLAQVVDPAMASSRPSEPDIPKDIGVSTLLGMGVGFAAMVVIGLLMAERGTGRAGRP